MTRGGPNGLIHVSCRPRSKDLVVLLVTILACVYLVQVSMTCCQGSKAGWKPRLLCESTKR
eukprot:9976749-Prorocentrum_lima.AAC.1